MSFDHSQWDPWYHIYFGASLGCDSCFEASLAQMPDLPDEARGDAFAITARGWWTLGRPREAEEAWSRAVELGGYEVDALRPFLHPEGEALAVARAVNHVRPGLAADAWCDVAALRLHRRDRGGALRALTSATEVCPDHGEARHWLRTLAEPHFEAELKRRLRATTRRPRNPKEPRLVVSRDLESLLPLQANGWLSPTRHSRRVMHDDRGPAPRGTALARLLDAGISGEYGHLATEAELAVLPAAHTLADAEILIDEVLALRTEGRAYADLLGEVWEDAQVADEPTRLRRTARFVCEVAVAQPALAALGRAAADALVAHPESALDARAYRAWFGVALGEQDAPDGARHVLSTTAPPAHPWHLALAALHRAGAATEVADEIARALKDPRKKEHAKVYSGKRARRPDELWLFSRAFPTTARDERERADDWE